MQLAFMIENVRYIVRSKMSPQFGFSLLAHAHTCSRTTNTTEVLRSKSRQLLPYRKRSFELCIAQAQQPIVDQHMGPNRISLCQIDYVVRRRRRLGSLKACVYDCSLQLPCTNVDVTKKYMMMYTQIKPTCYYTVDSLWDLYLTRLSLGCILGGHCGDMLPIKSLPGI